MARALATAFLCALVGAGCSGSDGKEAVTGTVTLKGKNLDSGTVTFVPAAGGAPAAAQVTDGAFAIPKDKGLLPGKYKVAISSPDGKTPDNDPDAAPGPSGNFASKERIPAKFNTETTLEVEVKTGGPNEFKFAVP